MQITVCAFTDRQSNSISYKKFQSIEKAVEFYRKMLEKDFVNVISTRKINREEDKFNGIPEEDITKGL